MIPSKNSKKGQVTVFIIVGIIILFITGLFLYLRRERLTGALSPLQLQAEEIPVEFRPVNSLIEDCLYQTAKEGLIKLGERGGFIDLVGNGIVTKADPVNSDAVKFETSSDFSVPYWWYLKSDNRCSGNCQFDIIPDNRLFLTKGQNRISIESQLEDYINQNLMTCLNNFQELKNQGFVIEEKGEINPTVSVTQNDVVAQLDYPLTARKTSSQDLENFYVRLPVNIMKIYDIAKTLTEMQGEYNVLEKHTLNIIEAHQGVDREKLPPFSKPKFRIGSEVTWDESQVGEKLKGALASDIQLLRVYGTRNYEPYSFPGNSLYDSLYNRGMLIQGTEDWSDVEARITYTPWWGLYLNLHCDAGKCRPESVMSDIFAIIGIQDYSFVYDISFPVLVELYDPFAFNNEGYRFQFFMESNIRENEPMKTEFSPTSALFLDSTMLCDENKRTSGNITINIKDELSGKPVPSVQVAHSSYQENCLIGEAGNGSFVGRFPVMLGGTVSFLANDYISFTQRFDTKRLMKKSGSVWILGEEANLTADEEAIVTLSKKEDLQEGDFSSSAVFYGNQSGNSEIKLSPGAYDISVSLFYNKPLRIPPSTRQYGDEEVPIPEFNMDQGFRIGGLSFNYTFTKADLQKDEITFYVLNPDIASIPEEQRVVEDLNIMGEVDELSQKYKGVLVPKFR
jgi:hypothetical protein